VFEPKNRSVRSLIPDRYGIDRSKAPKIGCHIPSKRRLFANYTLKPPFSLRPISTMSCYNGSFNHEYHAFGHSGQRRSIIGISDLDPDAHGRRPWNAGNMVGAKRPLKPRDVWAIRFFLDEHRRLRDRALFDLAIDSKLRGCDIVKMKIGDIVASGVIRNRATVIQQKTKRPVKFELMTEARQTLLT
jgi:hypothetical protein